MPIAALNGHHTHYRCDGPADGAPVLFANSLGTDMRLWDAIMPLLPSDLRLIRYDMRGHGLSDAPPAPYTMGSLVSDGEALLDHLNIRDCVIVGCSIGGMIAQGLAVKRPDQVRAMVLSNTAMRIATPEIWSARIATVAESGIGALADEILQRWFSKPFHADPNILQWRHMLTRTPPEGYMGCSAAISGTDFMASTAQLTLPTLAIAGSEDGSTPPDMVRETAALIKGARFHLIRGPGHLPCVEKPQDFADALNAFLSDIAHR